MIVGPSPQPKFPLIYYFKNQFKENYSKIDFNHWSNIMSFKMAKVICGHVKTTPQTYSKNGKTRCVSNTKAFREYSDCNNNIFRIVKLFSGEPLFFSSLQNKSSRIQWSQTNLNSILRLYSENNNRSMAISI